MSGSSRNKSFQCIVSGILAILLLLVLRFPVELLFFPGGGCSKTGSNSAEAEHGVEPDFSDDRYEIISDKKVTKRSRAITVVVRQEVSNETLLAIGRRITAERSANYESVSIEFYRIGERVPYFHYPQD